MTMRDTNTPTLLGDIQITPEAFPDVESVIAGFQEESFFLLSWRKQFRKINEALCNLIQKTATPCFLLSSVLDFIHRINQNHIAKEPYHFALFEFWLNNFSNLTEAENAEIRAKIAGKHVPRGDYQGLFPIGMDKIYPGSHYVIAHLSPDIDTMVASFWGWLDAFAARVGSSLHRWFLPDGPPDSPFTSMFQGMLGKNLFQAIPRTTSSLSLTSLDLVNQRQISKVSGDTLIEKLIHPESNGKAIILVNQEGHYLGDWHPSDIELARQVTLPYKSCLRWFENHLHSHLISLFAKENLSLGDFQTFQATVFHVQMNTCEPVVEFNRNQKEFLGLFLKEIFKLEKGLESTYQDLIAALNLHLDGKITDFLTQLEQLPHHSIFNQRGHFDENRSEIFNQLKGLIHLLDEAMQASRNFVERLDIQLQIKSQVLGTPPLFLTMQSDLEEMRLKMEHREYLTVVIQESEGNLFPVGIIRAADLARSSLGTVSFRDFCNFEEVKMSSHFEVISVMDHHKNNLKTSTVPTLNVADVQSCNILLAEQAFLLNDQYSLGGLSRELVEEQLNHLPSFTDSTPGDLRIQQRLLQRGLAAKRPATFYIHPVREKCEYLCFLQAILDDTDLLTKVSHRDLICIAELLNRLKSLSMGKEVEIIAFDDIPRDKNFISVATQRILQQPDMYSIYKHVYLLKEQSIESNLKLCIEGKPSNIFIDAKEQNGCARVGQTKLFKQNFPYFSEHAMAVRKIWLDKSRSVYNEHPEIDLHMHMISTVASAEEVYHNQMGSYTHLDELWLWVPPTQSGFTHLNSFLVNFQAGAKKALDKLSVEFIGKKSIEFVQIFSQGLPQAHHTFSPENLLDGTIAILRFGAGKLNSRKSMISPFLPRLVS